MEGFNTVLSSTLDLRTDIHEKASQNITKAQQKQQHDYNFCHLLPAFVAKNAKVCLKIKKEQIKKEGESLSNGQDHTQLSPK